MNDNPNNEYEEEDDSPFWWYEDEYRRLKDGWERIGDGCWRKRPYKALS